MNEEIKAHDRFNSVLKKTRATYNLDSSGEKDIPRFETDKHRDKHGQLTEYLKRNI